VRDLQELAAPVPD